MDIWMISGCEHELRFKVQNREISSHNSFYEMERLVHHENKNVIAVFNIIFWVGRKTTLSVLMRIILKKITSSHNGKVVPVHTMKMWGVDMLWFYSCTRWRCAINFVPFCLTREEWAPSTHRIGGFVAFRVILNALEKRKFICLSWELNHHSSVVQFVT